MKVRLLAWQKPESNVGSTSCDQCFDRILWNGCVQSFGHPQGARASGDHDRNGEQEGKQVASGDQAALGRPIQLLSERCPLGADVRAGVSLLSVLGSNLSESTQLAGAAAGGGQDRLRADQ